MKGGETPHRLAPQEAGSGPMTNTSYIALSRQVVLRSQLDAVAQNIANASTPAYKGQHIYFKEHLARANQTAPLSYVSTLEKVWDFRPGPVTQTGGELDLALSGDGFFAVDAGASIQYTRNGAFARDFDGQLVTAAGHMVLDSSDRPIPIPADAGRITVAEDGTVSGAGGEIARLKIVRFENTAALVEMGGGLFASGQPGVEAAGTVVRQGAVEGANIEPIAEMTRMIDLLRSYQSVKRMLDQDFELQRQAIDKLTRVS